MRTGSGGRSLSGAPGVLDEAGTKASRKAGTAPMLLSLGLMGQALVPLWGNGSDLEGRQQGGGQNGGRGLNDHCCIGQPFCTPSCPLGGHLTINLLSQEGLSRAGPGKQGPSRQKPCPPLTCRGALIAHGGAGAAAVHGRGLGRCSTGATACIIHALVCFSIHQTWGTLEGSEGALRKWPTGSLGQYSPAPANKDSRATWPRLSPGTGAHGRSSFPASSACVCGRAKSSGASGGRRTGSPPGCSGSGYSPGCTCSLWMESQQREPPRRAWVQGCCGSWVDGIWGKCTFSKVIPAVSSSQEAQVRRAI